MAPITDVLTITIDHFILSFKSRTPLPIIFLGDFVAFFFFFSRASESRFSIIQEQRAVSV